MLSRNNSFDVILFVFFLICDVNLTWCEEQSSLAFVIDDTESMGEDIENVINGADRIMDLVLDKKSSLIQEMVLVTFNDPAVKLRNVTRDRYLFKEYLRSISSVSGGGDCPEKALTGIETALRECRPGSYVYVFTDDGANDDQPQRRVNSIRTICQEKQIQVVFIITPNQFCGRPENKNFDYYNLIATGTSGQVFRLSRKSEVEELLKYVEVTITGKKTVDMSKIYPKNVWSTFNFAIDDQTQYAIVSASGKNVLLELVSGPTRKFNKTVWINNVKIITLDEAGPYSIRVKGSDDTSVVVFKRTDFSFQHGFSETITNTIEGTSKQSTTDTKSYLLVYVDDTSGTISIKDAVIYDMAENIIDRLPLHHISKDLYATPLFIPPQSTFKIAVEAVTSTGKVIRRISKTPITPKIKQKVPQVVIEEGDASDTVYASYGSSVSLTCVVNAYPPPTITWYYGRNHELTPEMTVVETVIREPYTHRSILFVTNAKESQQFSCKAENLVGKGEQLVHVRVRSPFLNRNTNRRAEVTQVKYGDEKEIFCDIQTNFPNDISVAWYRNSRLTDNISPSAEYTITTNNQGSRLRIKHASERDIGSFYCFAWLKNNRNINTQMEIPVRVTGIEAPKIDERIISHNALVHENVNIPCKLLTGVPKPSIMWLFKRQNTREFVRLNTNDYDQLKLDDVGLENAGQYKCIATNFQGQDDRVVMDLNVYVKPKINRALSNETHILENNTIELNCRADTGTPPPSIVWFYKKQGSDTYLPLLKGNALRIDKTNRSNSGHYKCVATNTAGSDEHIVQLFVEEIPEIEKQMRTVEALEHTSIQIPCKVTKGIPKPRVLWQFKSKSSSAYGRPLESDLLTINNLNPTQTGHYRCLAENRHGKDEYVVELNVHVKPIIDKQITKLTKREGTDVEIRCTVLRGIPQPEVNWYFKGHGDKDFQMYGSEEVLKINQVSLGNSGQYKCTANNIDGHDEHTIEIVVEAPPRITNNVTSYDAVINDTVLRIPCNVVGYPTPSIVWTNMEHNPIINDAYMNIDGATLVIKNLTKTSESSFICKATNRLGTDEKRFNTSVISYINDYKDVRKLYILMGSSSRINCSVPHNDSDMARWFKNDELVGMESVFEIIDAKIIDDGNYTCRVSNSTGSVNGATIEVMVGWRPEFDDEETNATIVWEGNQQRLSCSHSSRFNSEMTWLHNGEIIDVGTKTDIIINDLGNYTCRVNNPHKTLEKHFQVISKTCLINRLNEISSNVPLILNENSQLAALQTRNSFISIEPRAQLKLSCLNSNTFQNFPGQTDLTAICENEYNFLVDGKIHKFTDLHCNRRIAFEISRTKENCFDNDSEMIRVGFKGKDSIDVFEVCLDSTRNVTLYTKVDMVNPNYGNMENSFSSSDIEYIIYGKTDQSMEGLCQFVNAKDIAYGPAQLATFVPFNEIPCLSKWEKEGWNKVEDRVRYIVLSNPEVSTVTVWSGTSELLSNHNGNTIRYFWKVVKNHNTRETLAIVHIDGENPNSYDVLCNNDCEYDWLPFLQFPTFCCVLDAFVTRFEIPKQIFL